MNTNETLIYDILDMVIEECSQSFLPISREDIIGKGGNENVRMARCIFATQLLFSGYSDITIYTFLGRTRQSFEDILYRAKEYRKTSWVYRKMYDICSHRCEEIQERGL